MRLIPRSTKYSIDELASVSQSIDSRSYKMFLTEDEWENAITVWQSSVSSAQESDGTSYIAPILKIGTYLYLLDNQEIKPMLDNSSLRNYITNLLINPDTNSDVLIKYLPYVCLWYGYDLLPAGFIQSWLPAAETLFNKTSMGAQVVSSSLNFFEVGVAIELLCPERHISERVNDKHWEALMSNMGGTVDYSNKLWCMFMIDPRRLVNYDIPDIETVVAQHRANRPDDVVGLVATVANLQTIKRQAKLIIGQNGLSVESFTQKSSELPTLINY